MSKFWANNISNLFGDYTMIPKDSSSLAEKLNAITRLALAVSILIALFNPVIAISTLSLSIVIILSIYYSSVDANTDGGVKESYEDIGTANDICGGLAHPSPPQLPTAIEFVKDSSRLFCNDYEPLAYDCSAYSPNQQLLGCANPKTFRPPIVAAPSHELAVWKASDLTTHSAINTESNFDVYRSGYHGSNYTGSDSGYGGYTNTKCQECAYTPCMCSRLSNLPSNMPSSVQQPSQTNISYIDRVATQTLQPGVYQRNGFDEPINSMIGISRQDQFDPMRIDVNRDSVMYSVVGKNGRGGCGGQCNVDGTSTFENRNIPQVGGYGVVYDDRSGMGANDINSLIRQSLKVPIKVPGVQSEADIYDPRFTGYGPTDRGYIEPVTGQPRFFYDDIDAVRMPNYISRNNVDIFPWAQQYGTDQGGSVECGDGYKQLANNAFLDSTIKFRTELQERLMRKRNAELWQQRVAPITTMNNTYRV